MLRLPFVMTLLSLAVLPVTGCVDLDLFGGSRGLFDIPERLALDATALAVVVSDTDHFDLTSTDPGIVSVQLADAERVELTGVAVGATTLVFQEDSRRVEYAVEVVAAERFEVLLVEEHIGNGGPVPVAPVAGKGLLAEVEHQLVVAYYDSNGLIFGRGLAEFSPPAQSQDCEVNIVGPFDAFCVRLEPDSGPIRVDALGQQQLVGDPAISPDDIVNILVLRPDEEKAESGDRLEVDVVGVSNSLMVAYGVQPRFTYFGNEFGYFAYTYYPWQDPQETTVTAVGFEQTISFRGNPEPTDSLWQSCATAFFPCY